MENTTKASEKRCKGIYLYSVQEDIEPYQYIYIDYIYTVQDFEDIEPYQYVSIDAPIMMPKPDERQIKTAPKRSGKIDPLVSDHVARKKP